jgi:hypothetical protein
MKKAIVLLTIVALGFFTELYVNLWSLLTYNAYSIPKESNVFIFKATEISEGSGEMWLYGEDYKYYYALNDEPDYVPPYFKLRKGLEPEGFDKFDYKTWFPSPISSPSGM